jgi:hypothetical protein
VTRLLSRRAFVGGLVAGYAGLAGCTGGGLFAQRREQVDGEVLRRRLEALSLFGRPAGGAFADGVSNFDGDLGVMGSLGAIESLTAAQVRTRHPLEMAGAGAASHLSGKTAGLSYDSQP